MDGPLTADLLFFLGTESKGQAALLHDCTGAYPREAFFCAEHGLAGSRQKLLLSSKAIVRSDVQEHILS